MWCISCVIDGTAVIITQHSDQGNLTMLSSALLIPSHLSSFKSFLTLMPIIHTICHIQCVLLTVTYPMELLASLSCALHMCISHPHLYLYQHTTSMCISHPVLHLHQHSNITYVLIPIHSNPLHPSLSDGRTAEREMTYLHSTVLTQCPEECYRSVHK